MKNLSTPSYRRIRPLPLILLAFMTLAAAASAQQPLTFTKSFTPDTIGPGGVSTLRFVMTNNTSSPIRNLDFTDVLPSGVSIASPANDAFTCRGGTLSAPAGGGTISYSGGAVGGFTTCSVVVDVTSSALGTHTNVSGDLTSDAGNSGSATADLTVAADRPGFSKSFSPGTVTFGGRSTLTFLIDNTANSQGAIHLTFTDNLPTGMVVASPVVTSNTCGGGNLTATAGSSVISYGPAFFGDASVGAFSSCTLSVDVVANAVGALVNTTGDLTSVPATGGSPRSSGPATATLTVSFVQISLTKTFIDDPVAPGDTVTLGFTVRNLDRNFSATNISFTDNLSNTLAGLTAVGLPLANPCGFGSSLSGSSLLTLSGGTLAAGASCTFSVTLQVPTSSATGSFTNTTSAITADLGGDPVSGAPATDLLFVAPAPVLTKEFTDDPASAGGSVTLEFTITNSSATSTATDITFNDVFDVVLPTASATPAPGFCGAGSTATFTPLNSGPATLVVAGASLAGGASCTFSLTLDVVVGATSGIYPNTTSEITATVDGETVTGTPASDDLVIVTGLTLSKEFIDDPVLPGGTVTLRFTLGNVGQTTLPVSDIAFTDELNAVITGLVAQGLPFAACGGTVSGTSTISFTGGSLATAASCSFDVTVAVPASAALGSVALNTTSEVTGTVDGHGVTAPAATDVLEIAAVPVEPPTVAAPTVAPEPSDEGSAATATATFTDTGGTADEPFTCTVDYGDGSGPVAGTVSGFTCTGPSHVYGDNGGYTVTVVVTDAGGLSGSASSTHQVLNVAPTVATPAVAPEPSDEGSSVTASATFSDPGFDDTPFTCTVDYGDGGGPVAGTVSGTTCSGPAHTYADNGDYAVEVTVTDKDGGTGSASTSHQVDNVAPTITGSTNSAADCGATADGDLVEVSADFSDPGFDNAAAGTFEDFTDSTIDWGDGTVESATVDETPGGAGTPTTGTVGGSHVYATGGIYTVTVTVADDDGGTDEVILTALVTGVGLNDGSLQIVGTSGKDKVTVKQKKDSLVVTARFEDDDDEGHDQVSFPVADVTLIEVQTCGDKDQIQIHNSVDVPAVLDGGGGSDLVQAGDGASFLFGGPGRDHLFAGDAGDVLDGGPGNDHVTGGKGNDVLQGGEGDDQLFGRQGDDALDGGPGSDLCEGGSGTDTLVNCEATGDDGDDDDDDDDDG